MSDLRCTVCRVVPGLDMVSRDCLVQRFALILFDNLPIPKSADFSDKIMLQNQGCEHTGRVSGNWNDRRSELALSGCHLCKQGFRVGGRRAEGHGLALRCTRPIPAQPGQRPTLARFPPAIRPQLNKCGARNLVPRKVVVGKRATLPKGERSPQIARKPRAPV
jgi:hypothetical protein